MEVYFSKFVNGSLKVLFLPILVVAAGYFVYRFIYNLSILNLILFVFFLASFFFFYRGMQKGCDPKKLLVFTLIYGLIIRLIWIFSLDNQPVSDFLGMFERSAAFLQGDYSMFHGHSYYARYPHMTLTVLYFALIRLFSTNPLVILKLVNVILSTLDIFLIYLIVREIFSSEKKGLWGAFLAAIYMPMIIYNAVYCSENLALPFYLLSLYLFILVINEKRSLPFLFLSAFCLSIANLFRMVGIIMLIAYAMYLLIYFKKQWRVKFKAVGYIIIAFLIPLITVSGFLKTAGITEYDLWRGCETQWTSVLRGSNIETFGRWNQEDALFIESFRDDQELEKAIKQKVWQRFTETPLDQLACFWLGKYSRQWSNGDFSGAYWAQSDAQHVKIDLQGKGAAYLQLVYLLILCLVYRGLYNKKQYLLNPKVNLLYIIFCGFALLYLITEMQERYAFIVSWLFILLAPTAFENNSFGWRPYLQMLRPRQWIKNFFVFGALIFSSKFIYAECIARVTLTFLTFCLICSTVYILNDLIDVERDKNHPQKKKRPLASGTVSKKQALSLMVILFMSAFVLAFMINRYLVLILALYFVNNLLYSFKFKHVVLLDVMSIAFGFLLRVVAGGIVLNVRLSAWILLCTLFISLFLGFEKRKQELMSLQENASKHRMILDNYSVAFLNQLSTIVCACTILFYSLYTVFAYNHQYMVITNIFVIYGLFRYKYLTDIKGLGGSPTEAVLTDKAIIIDVLLWGLANMVILIATTS